MKYELSGLVNRTTDNIEETLRKIWLYGEDESGFTKEESDAVAAMVEEGIREAVVFGTRRGWKACGSAIIKQVEEDVGV